MFSRYKIERGIARRIRFRTKYQACLFLMDSLLSNVIHVLFLITALLHHFVPFHLLLFLNFLIKLSTYYFLGDDTFTEDYQTTEDIILSTVDDSTSPIMEEESFTAMTSSPESTIKSTTTPTNKPKIKLTNKPSIKPTIKQSPITKQPIKQIITTRNFTTNTSYVTNLQRKVYVITRKPMYPPSNIKPTIKQVPNMATTTLTLITPKIILKKPPQVIKITPKPNNRAENEILKNDISIVPVNENNDEELLVTQRNVPILKEKKLESQKIIKTSVGGGTSTTVVIIAVVCIAMGAVLTVVIMRRRYMCVRFKNIRSRSCGDSQSDVRFLTGDEILDFTPATPK